MQRNPYFLAKRSKNPNLKAPYQEILEDIKLFENFPAHINNVEIPKELRLEWMPGLLVECTHYDKLARLYLWDIWNEIFLCYKCHDESKPDHKFHFSHCLWILCKTEDKGASFKCPRCNNGSSSSKR